MPVGRVYDVSTYKKHKWPKGWGSLCPKKLTEAPQDLLDTGAEVERSIYNVSGEYAFQANQHDETNGHWHGFPIPWDDLPGEAKDFLIESGRLNEKFYDKAVRKGWGSEFRQ